MATSARETYSPADRVARAGRAARASEQEIRAKTSKKVVELASFTEGEPGNLYVAHMGQLKKIAGRKLEQFVEICSRPILDTQVWNATEQKLHEENVKIKAGEPGQFYDPLSPASELTVFTQQIKCYEQIQDQR